jgi:hypothetical protein
MEKILLDEALRSRLNGLNTELELTDEVGRTVGHFLPPDVYKRMLYAYAMSKCPHTAAELAQIRQEREGARPLAEFWKEMGRQ